MKTVFARSRPFSCNWKKGALKGYHFDYPDSLPQEQKDALFAMLYPIALSAFSIDPSEDVACDVRRHMFSADGLLVVVDNDPAGDERAVAFRMWNVIPYKIIEGDILYLAGMCVHKDYQGQGIGASLLNYVLFQDHRRQMSGVDQLCPLPECKWVVLRTQNPVMKRCFDDAIGTISYPQQGNSSVPTEIQKVAQRVAKHLNDGTLDHERLICSGTYGRSLYGNHLQAPSEYYASIFEGIRQNRGDAMVCVWQRS